jgi:hypothetical protein
MKTREPATASRAFVRSHFSLSKRSSVVPIGVEARRTRFTKARTAQAKRIERQHQRTADVPGDRTWRLPRKHANRVAAIAVFTDQDASGVEGK